MYTYDKSNCIDKFAGMIHALACCAAVCNRWPHTIVETRDEAGHPVTPITYPLVFSSPLTSTLQ